MKKLFIAFFIFSTSIGYTQDVNILSPNKVVDLTLNFSKEYLEKYNSEESMQKCSEIWKQWQIEGRGWQDATNEEQEILQYCNETKPSPWTIIGEGCSWYCAGGPNKVTASSELNSQGKNTYAAKNAHDLNYKNAWVEGVPGYGIGEYLLYSFSAQSPRVNQIIVVNGYVKSESAWKNNSRVKKLKVYKNDKPIAILHLEDKRASQYFDLEPLGYNDRENYDELENKPDWTIKFEILEVYKGDKYDDVVLSEIYFDGLDVHCLAKGTLITMADNSLKPIQFLSIGDSVKSLSPNGTIINSSIKQLASPTHSNLIDITFNDGTILTCTSDHPILGMDNQWYSFSPSKTLTDYDFNSVSQLKIGIQIKSIESKKIVSIKTRDIKVQTYTIVELEKGNTFIANGIYVGTEKLKKSLTMAKK